MVVVKFLIKLLTHLLKIRYLKLHGSIAEKADAQASLQQSVTAKEHTLDFFKLYKVSQVQNVPLFIEMYKA